LEIVKISVNGRIIETPAGTSLLEACLEAGVYIPHLCYHPDLKSTGDCGLCVVEIAGTDDLVTACDVIVVDRMTVRTDTEKAQKSQLAAMEVILAIHPSDCGTCVKYLNCELQSLKQYFAIDQLSIPRHPRLFAVNDRNPLFRSTLTNVFCVNVASGPVGICAELAYYPGNSEAKSPISVLKKTYP
jgi:formate dehydrogenase beta subunit